MSTKNQKKKKTHTHTKEEVHFFFSHLRGTPYKEALVPLFFFFLGELKVVSYLSSQDELHSCSVSFIAVFLFPFFIYLLFYLFCFSAILRLCSLHYFFFCTFLFSLRYPARIRGSQRVLPLALAEKEPKQKTKRKTTTKEANNRSSFAFVSFFFFLPAEDEKKKKILAALASFSNGVT